MVNGDYSSQNCVGVSDRNVMGVMVMIPELDGNIKEKPQHCVYY
jgi:hypothetical protein